MSLCVWFSSLASFQDVHGDDIFSNWSGVSFEIGDVVFILGSSGLMPYVVNEFSDIVTEELPYIVVGPYRTGYGHTILKSMSIAYSPAVYGAVTEVLPSSTNYCTDSQETSDVCSLLNNINNMPDLMFFPHVESEAVEPADQTPRLLVDTTEAEWTEEAGAPFDWLVDRVTFDANDGGGGGDLVPEYSDVSYEAHSGGSSPKNRLQSCEVLRSNRGVMRYRVTIVSEVYYLEPHVIIYNSDTGPVTTSCGNIETGDDYDGTVWHNYAHLNTEIVYEAAVGKEYYVVGDNTYTNSKPGQGVCVCSCINDDGTPDSSNNMLLHHPSPGRYSEFGRAVGGIYRTDGSKDLLVGALGDEEWYIFSLSGTTFTQELVTANYNDKYTFAFISSPLMLDCFIMVQTDGTEYYSILYHWDGTTLTTLWLSTTMNMWYGRAVILSFDFATEITHYARIATGQDAHIEVVEIDELGAETVIQTLNGLDPTPMTYWEYSYLSNVHSDGYLFNVNTQYDTGKRSYIRTMKIVGTSPPVLSIINDDEDIVGAPDMFRNKEMNVVEVSKVDPTSLDVLMMLQPYTSSTQATHFWFNLSAGSSASFETGHFYLSSNSSLSRMTMPEGTISIESALVTATPNTGGEVRFAFSVDEGITWQTWGGSSNITLTSLDDIKVNGANYTDFNASITAIDVTLYSIIDIAFALNRPAGMMSDTEAPFIEKYEYTVNDGTSTRTFECGQWPKLESDTKAEPASFEVHSNSLGNFYLLFLDSLKDLE